ncbi:MAG: DUF4332 domain-containing protein [Candidatus Promineifilaceae bacterium]
MANDNNNLIVAYFDSESAARDAAEQLMAWDKEKEELDLGAVGIITLDAHQEKVVVKEVGDRNTGKGALWGTAIGAGLGILTGGIALIPGLIAGAALGAGVGALDHKALGMDDEDAAKMAAQLRAGGAAVGVMCDDFEMDLALDKLVELGGTTSNFVLSRAAKEAIGTQAMTQAAATEAVMAAMAQDEAHVRSLRTTVVVVRPDMHELEAMAVAGLIAVSALKAEMAARLYEWGVLNAALFLAHGATPEGRADMAEVAGVDEQVILDAVKKVDLMRIMGVGPVYANLLFAASIESVPDLAQRDAVSVQRMMAAANKQDKIAETTPSVEMVAGWIEQAKTLPRVVTY